MNLHAASLFTDDVLQPAPGNVEGLAHQRIGIADAFPLDGERLEFVPAETKLYAHRVLVPVPMCTGTGATGVPCRRARFPRALCFSTFVSNPSSRESEARWAAIVEAAVDGIVVIDAHGRIEAFNPAAERLFGYSEGDVLGRNVSMLMPSSYAEEHDGFLARYMATGEARIIGIGREVTGRRHDGSTFPLHLSVGAMEFAGERKFTGILHDLSSRVRLEAELRARESQWRAVINAAVDGIIVIDGHGRIEAFNPSAERLFGYSEDEVRGKNVSLLMPSPDRERHDGYLSRYLSTGEARIIGKGREVTGLKRDGTRFPLHLSVGRMAEHGEAKFTGIVHDLSQRVTMEEQLREQTALARLGEMAAVIAHEVKNPLAGIRGAIQVLSGRLAGTPEAEVMSAVIGRIDALNDLMKDLLLYARPPQPKVLPVDVGHVLMNTARLIGADPGLNHVAIVVEGSASPVQGDAELLNIVFLNLMVNGAHAVAPQGRIVASVQDAGDVCRIVIADSGPGIPPEIRDKIFTPFFTTKSRGTGLGLPTVKRLIDAHRGRITIECPPSGGTHVAIELPRTWSHS
jgi:two-component system, LuxR family, sensor kinase FixL